MAEATAWARARHMADIALYRAGAELRSEASRTYAGYLWWVVHPLLSLAVYYVAFEKILGRGGPGYATFLFCGIIFWQWFSSTVLRCSNSLIAARGLMQQVNLHKLVFPCSVVLVNLAKFAVTFVLLLVVLLLAGHAPALSWSALVPLLLLQVLLVVAFGCATASVSPFFPDFHHLLETTLQLLFFLSGIFFDAARLGPELQGLLRFNPLASLITQYRRVLLDGQWPEWGALAIPCAEVLVVLFLAVGAIHRFDKLYAKLS